MSNLGFGEHTGLAEFATRLQQQGVDEGVVSETLTQVRKDLIESHNKDLTSLHQQVAACRYCDNVSTTPHLPPNWNLDNPSVLVIGLRPFQKSQADKKLVEGLKEAGLRSKNTGYTSLIRCFPQNGGDKKQVQAIVNACTTRFLFAEIERINPKVICPIGSIATQVLIDPQNGRGSQHYGIVHFFGCWTIIPISASIFSKDANQSAHDDFIRQIKTAAQVAGIEDAPS